MPRHLDVDRISVVLVQRIESEFQVATNPSMDGTRGAPISWKKLTKGDQALEEASARVYRQLFL